VLGGGDSAGRKIAGGVDFRDVFCQSRLRAEDCRGSRDACGFRLVWRYEILCVCPLEQFATWLDIIGAKAPGAFCVEVASSVVAAYLCGWLARVICLGTNVCCVATGVFVWLIEEDAVAARSVATQRLSFSGLPVAVDLAQA